MSLVADGQGVSDVKIKGAPLQADKVYRLALLSFNATGGDDYPIVSDRPSYVNTGFVDAEVLKQYIENTLRLKSQTMSQRVRLFINRRINL